MNTAIIIANQGDGDGATYAARVCADLVITSGGGDYGDWYLPSKYELNLMYLQKATIGGFNTNFYWSSTGVNTSYAWGQYFFPGTQLSFYKSNPYYVRAVRAF